ncbi:hypothetical protein PUV54_03555 [Hyphococcus flavus]|uniref:Transporter suffix domain-containing protein n=1 Tax=Hyphococcus flavus TaxID=1866326 RepID=A0AAE9ZD05_9PROT|nr:hypothetical protein [Hyphococcus flavus]WDI32266.1 hypothetical protein PUV54_03555 [Hyphococcus flavus]
MSWKKLALLAVWGVAIAAWVGLAVFYTTDPSTTAWTIGVAIGAVLLEVAFWSTAAILGLSLWESRKAVWRFLTRPFRKKSSQ